MEKYLVKKRAPSNSEETAASSSKTPRRKGASQRRLKDLKGVVILEDLAKAKSVLTDPASNDEQLENTLRSLAKKVPGRDILQQTGIGKTVRKLTKHENLTVQLAAKKLFDLWKDHVIHKAKQQKQEVRFDLESQRLRDIAKRWFGEALSTRSDDEVVIRLEDTVFYSCKRILTAPYRFELKLRPLVVDSRASVEKIIRADLHSYIHLTDPSFRRTCRLIAQKLRNDVILQNKLVAGSITMEDFVKKYKCSI